MQVIPMMPTPQPKFSLRDLEYFPNLEDLPMDNDPNQLVDLTYFDEPDPEDPDAISDPIKHWCLLAEIIHYGVNKDGCPVIFVRGANDRPFFVYFFVKVNATALYSWRRFCQPGNVMAIMYASSYDHDGVLAVGEGEMGNVKTFPCNLETLFRIGEKLSNTPSKKCDVCDETGKLKCAGCLAISYCSQECQRRNWKMSHKKECAIVSQVSEWKWRNWKEFDGYWTD